MPWPNRLPDQIPAIRDPAAKAPAARSGERVAAAIRGANKAEVDQILDSLAAPPKPPGTSSGSSGSSDGLDSWAFLSDGHTGRSGYPCRRPSDDTRGDSRSETDSCRTVRAVRTVMPPVWLRVLADSRQNTRGSTPLSIGQRLTMGTEIDGFGGVLSMGVTDATSCRILGQVYLLEDAEDVADTRGQLAAWRQANGWT